MSDSPVLLAAARRILTGARADLDRKLHESACVSAHRGAVLATQAWLECSGQSHVANSVQENLSLSPATDSALRADGALLDRHRVEEGYPHRSSHVSTDPVAEAEGAVAAGERVLAFVERQLST